MRPFRLAALAAVAVIATACTSGAAEAPRSTLSAPASAAAVSSPVPGGAASAPSATDAMAGGMASVQPSVPAVPSATRIAVTLTDMLTIEPKTMTVPHGVPVTFVITNAGSMLHEFTLGDAAQQDAHDAEMRATGSMSMPKDEPNAVGVEPGQTKELTFTFAAAGTTLAGCHVAGHYQAGMKGEIRVE